VEASGSYATFYLLSGRRITVSKNLRKVEELLADDQFFRVHNSQLVRMSHVESLNVRAGTLTLRGGRQVPFAVRKRDEVRRRLAALMVGADPEATAWTQAAESGPEPVG
jgi:two-component system LytT family response regulator